MASWAWAMLCIAVLVIFIDRFRLARHVRRLRARHEELDDEMWEVQSAVEAQRRAEAASDAKSRFLATLSHELRTPLNGILGLADLLGGTPLDREQQSYVTAITTSGVALTTLIDEILDFSRIEAGRLELDPAPLDLGALVEGVVELLAPRAQDKGLEIASWVDPALPAWVVGDAVRLRQVLTNLAGNAVKFTERGGVGLSVEPGPQGTVVFTVADTGPGVPEAHRSSIFEEFEQGDGSTTRRHGGTGLGLAISRRIVSRMGGALTIGERNGGGSMFGFAVTLPTAPARASDPVAGLDLAGRHALVVAAGPFQAEFLARRLRAAGAEASVLPDVSQALRRLERAPSIHLLCVDCALGEAAIGELARAARRTEVRRAMLLFSPFERRAFGQALAVDFDGWLVKPVRAGSLTARLSPVPMVAARETGGPPALRSGRGGLRVLLAEDNEINTLVAMSALGRLGAQVTHAADGSSALALALAALRRESPPFDVLLLDISMPGLDGFDVARSLRAAEAEAGAPPVRIIALTAHAFVDDREACFDAGIDEVLTKPIDFKALATMLSTAEPRRSAKG